MHNMLGYFSYFFSVLSIEVVYADYDYQIKVTVLF